MYTVIRVGFCIQKCRSFDVLSFNLGTFGVFAVRHISLYQSVDSLSEEELRQPPLPGELSQNVRELVVRQREAEALERPGAEVLAEAG